MTELSPPQTFFADDHRPPSSEFTMGGWLVWPALPFSTVDSVIVIGNVYMTPEKTMVANRNTLDRRDVYSVGKTDVISDRDAWAETLRSIGGDSLQPEIALCVDALAKGNMASAEYPARGPKVQTGSPKRASHNGAHHPPPNATGNEQYCDQSGVCFELPGNTTDDLLHYRLDLAAASANRILQDAVRTKSLLLFSQPHGRERTKSPFSRCTAVTPLS